MKTFRLLFHAALIASCCALAMPSAYGAGTPTHNSCAKTAAKAAPEPFKSNWEKCRGAILPDYMQDQPLGHENLRYSGLLYTKEAIRYLRSGEINKAMLMASAHTHYIADSSCIPHALVWNVRNKDDVLREGKEGRGVWGFLPASLQDYWIPMDEYIKEKHYAPIRITEPPMWADKWKDTWDFGRERYMHRFFDTTHGLKVHPDGFPTELIPDTTNWSAYDREFYGRWRAECIALEVLDRESILAGEDPIRFAALEDYQRALDHEMGNMCASSVAYYRYLTVAAKTEVEGKIEILFPGEDRLSQLAKRDPHIYLSPDAPWPLKRAATLLAMEMARASLRNQAIEWPAYGPSLKSEADALFRTVALPEGEEDNRILIAWRTDEEQLPALAGASVTGNHLAIAPGGTSEGHLLLRGEDLQSTIHLVDYLLDLTNAPLHGRTPVDVMFAAFRQEWPANALLEAVAATPDSEVYPQYERMGNPHKDNPAEWADKVHWMVWPNTTGPNAMAGPLPIFWNILYFGDMPLPDGHLIDLHRI
jgi:hypothetical protein